MDLCWDLESHLADRVVAKADSTIRGFDRGSRDDRGVKGVQVENRCIRAYKEDVSKKK